MAQLEDAVKAYRASLAGIETAKRAAEQRVRAARDKAEADRVKLAEAMVQAAREGTRQVDIIRITGYSREQVRTILRAGGVEPD